MLASELRQYDRGWGVRTPDLNRLWTLNQLCITSPATFDEIVALAEDHQNDLPFRHVNVDHDSTGRAVERAFTEAGWKQDRELLMVLDADADRSVDTTAVVELSEEQMTGLMKRWWAEEFPVLVDDDELDQFVNYNRREGKLWSESAFGVLDEDGVPLAITKARAQGTTGWVEDVYTAAEARGRGYARMLVTHVTELLRAAECDFIFIIADDNDWPKTLYSKIGYRPVGYVHTFHLDLRPLQPVET